MKFLSFILCVAIMLCFAGCGTSPAVTTTQPEASSDHLNETGSVTDATENAIVAIYEAPMAAVSMPVVTEQLLAKDSSSVIATYTRQDVTVTLPDADVAQAVELEIRNRIDKASSSAELVFSAAERDYTGQESWYPYAYAITYAPVRMDKNVLSLFGVESMFDGSPRSMTNPISLNYDLTTGAPLSLRTILHEENFADTVCDLILEGLKGQTDVLFEDYESIIRDRFATNVPVDSWYFSDEGICFYFAPYEIAPYANGTIVSQIPYERISGLLNDAYFPAEKTTYSGQPEAQVITDLSVLEDYTQFAELTFGTAEDKILISVDGSVSNVRLHYTGEDGTAIVILGVAGIGPTDAILAELSKDWAVSNLKISFGSDGQTQTMSLTENADGTLEFVE